MRPVLEVDTSVVINNWLTIRRLAGPSVLCAPVVKANAYGLGISRIAPALFKAGARDFFVADSVEGSQLRKVLGNIPNIYILNGFDEGSAHAYVNDNLTPLLNSEESATSFFRLFPSLDFGIQIETGLNRLGINAEEMRSLTQLCPGRSPTILMTHLACADESRARKNTEQLNRFREISSILPNTESSRYSISGSEGIFLDSSFHFDLVRPGISLYCAGLHPDLEDPIKISVRAIKSANIHPGESVGYGATWVAEKTTRVTTLAIGYSDGLPRKYDGKLKFFADEIPCEAVGRVSMDLVTVNTSGIPSVPRQFELVGRQQTLRDLAVSINQIPNSLLTSFGSALRREYVDDITN